jgi:hypothetical protein
MDQRISEHAYQLASIIRNKGYYGHFQLSATTDRYSTAGALPDVLSRYLLHLDSRNKATGEFSLFNVLDTSKDRKIGCELRLSYDHQQGFHISQLRISHNSDRTITMHVGHPMQLLGANAVKARYPKVPAWKAMLKGRRPFR